MDGLAGRYREARDKKKKAAGNSLSPPALKAKFTGPRTKGASLSRGTGRQPRDVPPARYTAKKYSTVQLAQIIANDLQYGI